MNSPLPLFYTPRTTLRPLALADAAAMHGLFGDPETMRFWDALPSADLAETTARVERLVTADPYWQVGWAILANSGGALLGFVNFHGRVPAWRRLSVGYMLGRAWWGQGLMEEAMTPFLDHCFGALEAHRVEALIEPGNVASARLAQRLGFARESGPLRDRMLVGGVFRDICIHGLLAPDWAARRR